MGKRLTDKRDCDDDDDDDLFKDFLDSDGLVNKITNTTTTTTYFIYLDSDIESQDKYRKAFNTLNSCTEKDTVRVILNTNGGHISTMIQLVEALTNTKAKTIAEVYRAYSAGVAIMLSCDEIDFKPFSSVMVHTTSSGTIGKAVDMKSYTDFLNQQTREISFRLYNGFLTSEEIENVLKGAELWFNQAECQERIKRRVPLREISN